MNLNDPGNLGQRLENELDKLDRSVEEGKMSEEDKQAILKFLNHLQANRHNKDHSNAEHMKNIRLTAVRTDTPLVRFDKETLDSFTVTLRHDYGCKKSTINDYKGSWKPFFRFLDREWASEIEFYNIDNDEIEKKRVFSDDEIDAMLNPSMGLKEADGRATCVIALLADTGMRIGMLLC